MAPGGAGGETGGSVGSDAGPPAGDASAGNDARMAATCSDEGPPPTPVSGFMKAEPRNQKFPFSTHFMGIFSDNPRCIGMTALADIDNDGDQDFVSGQRDVDCSGGRNANAPMIWWEYCGPDHWVRHVIGTGYRSAAGGGVEDFDGDGFADVAVGDSWFKNPGATVRSNQAWRRYATGAPGTTEQIAMGDVNGDGKLDVLHVVRSIQPQWWTPGPDPTATWTKGAELRYRQQQGAAIGDMDGDGRNDIVVGDHWWYKAANPAATEWTPMRMPFATEFAPGASDDGSAPVLALGDLDGDGDQDIVMHTHWGTQVAWLENQDGKGITMVNHMIAGRGAPFAAKRPVLHSLAVVDFDNDGDLDIHVGENQGAQWMYENTDGKATFAEHQFADGPAHDARPADVDCDGDIDLVGAPWGDPGDGAAGRSETIRAHVYFKNELVERGGAPVFARPKGEVWNVPNKGACK